MLRSLLVNLLIIALSCLLAFLSLEVAYRFYVDDFRMINFIDQKKKNQQAYPTKYDAELGWVPLPGIHQNDYWGVSITINSDEIRENGNNDIADASLRVLAVGDSFTFGDEVADGDSWPAILERQTGWRVYNGGVFGYGVDQIFLRMKKLVKKLQPDLVVFSFIPDDINRCELSERTAVTKPWFSVQSPGVVALQTSHMRPMVKIKEEKSPLRMVLGRSLMLHKIMMAVNPQFWLQGARKSTRNGEEGGAVACGILNLLEEFSEQNNLPVLVLVQYSRHEVGAENPHLKTALTCLDKDKLPTIDVYESLTTMRQTKEAEFESLYNLHMAHMSPAGNRFIASSVQQAVIDNSLNIPAGQAR